MVLVFGPSIMFIFTPYAIFIVPSCLLLLPISIVQPWIIETDVSSPSSAKVLFPLIGLMILILSFSIFTEWPLMTFIMLGWLPSLFSVKSVEIHLKNLKVSDAV